MKTSGDYPLCSCLTLSPPVVLTFCSSPTQLKMLSGKYVAFGRVDLEDEGLREYLERLDKLRNGEGGSRIPVGVADCGLVSGSEA